MTDQKPSPPPLLPHAELLEQLLAERNLVRGWKAIADVLGVSEDTAQRLSRSKRGERVPVYRDHRGVFARRGALFEWKLGQIRRA